MQIVIFFTLWLVYKPLISQEVFQNGEEIIVKHIIEKKILNWDWLSRKKFQIKSKQTW